MKSSWAYNNGKRIMKECLNTSNLNFGFVNIKGVLKYAENYEGLLMVKTYSNKSQCLKKVEKLKSMGYDCGMSISHPYTIIL